MKRDIAEKKDELLSSLMKVKLAFSENSALFSVIVQLELQIEKGQPISLIPFLDETAKHIGDIESKYRDAAAKAGWYKQELDGKQ